MHFYNSLANFLVRGTSIVSQLVVVPIAIGAIGKSGYGLWMAITSFAAIATTLDLGILNAVFNIAAGNSKKISSEIVAYAAIKNITLIAGALFLLILVIVWGFNINDFLNTGINRLDASLMVIVICGVALFTLPFSVFNQVCLAKLEGPKIAPILIFGNLAIIPIAYTASRITSASWIFVLIILLPGFIAQTSVAIISISSGRYPVTIIFRKLMPATKRIKIQGKQFFLIQIATLGSLHVNNLIIAALLSLSEVAVYSLANRYFSIISILLSVYLGTAWPSYARMAKSADRHKLSHAFRRNLIKSTFFALAIAALLYLFKDPFFKYWTRSTITPSNGLIFAFCIYSIVNAGLGNLSALLNAVGSLKIQAKVALIMLGPNFLLSITLIKIMGAIGAIIASTVCSGLMVIYYMHYWKKIKGLYESD